MRKIVRASAHAASSGALPMSARVNTGEIAPTLVAQTSEGRGGTAGPMQLVPPMKAYNITPESGQGADLRACEVTTSTAVTVTEHAKQTDRGIRVVTEASGLAFNQRDEARFAREQAYSLQAAPGVDEQLVAYVAKTPRRAQALDGKDVRLADKTGALTASMNSSRVSNSRVGMVSYEVDKERGIPNPDGIRVDETTTSPTITAGGDPTERTDRGLRIVGERKDPVDCVTANSVQHYDVKSAQAGHLLGTTTTAVRRLTPTECERLQGFPDGWTVVEGVKRRAKR